MRSVLLIAIAFVIAGVSGWAHGLFIDRWGIPADVRAVTDQVENLSLEIDGWTAGSPRQLDDRTRKAAGAEGYFSRGYTHDATGATVHVTILCGRPGPISNHNPEVCFVNSGMRQLDDTAPATIVSSGSDSSETGGSADFIVADYRPPPSEGGPEIKTFWAWSPDGRSWSAPEEPRITFAYQPYLYRLYFTAPKSLFDTAAENGDAVSPVQQFMPEFLKRFAEVTPNNDSV